MNLSKNTIKRVVRRTVNNWPSAAETWTAPRKVYWGLPWAGNFRRPPLFWELPAYMWGHHRHLLSDDQRQKLDLLRRVSRDAWLRGPDAVREEVVEIQALDRVSSAYMTLEKLVEGMRRGNDAKEAEMKVVSEGFTGPAEGQIVSTINNVAYVYRLIELVEKAKEAPND